MIQQDTGFCFCHVRSRQKQLATRLANGTKSPFYRDQRDFDHLYQRKRMTIGYCTFFKTHDSCQERPCATCYYRKIKIQWNLQHWTSPNSSQKADLFPLFFSQNQYLDLEHIIQGTNKVTSTILPSVYKGCGERSRIFMDLLLLSNSILAGLVNILKIKNKNRMNFPQSVSISSVLKMFICCLHCC